MLHCPLVGQGEYDIKQIFFNYFCYFNQICIDEYLKQHKMQKSAVQMFLVHSKKKNQWRKNQ